MSKSNSPERGTQTSARASALAELRRPPVPEAVGFKVQSSSGTRAQVVAYVDARFVMDRFDHVAERCLDGEGWSSAYGEPRSSGDGVAIRCRIEFCGSAQEDWGIGSDEKAAASDALKRAAVRFGIGRVIYLLEAPWLEYGERGKPLGVTKRGKPYIPDALVRRLRAGYARALVRFADEFGEPLGHGDTAASVGFEGAEDGTPEAAAVEPSDGAGAEAGEVIPLRERPAGVGMEAVSAAPQASAPQAAAVKSGGYPGATIERLAEFLCGKHPSELEGEQAQLVADVVEAAQAAGLEPARLNRSLGAHMSHRDREAARAVFLRKLGRLTQPARAA